MRKKIFTFLLLGLLILGSTQLIYAAEQVGEDTSQQNCILNLLSEDASEKVREVISNFHAQMTVLREKLFTARESQNLEEAATVRDEMWELKEEKREAILEIVPDELKEQYVEKGFQKQQKFRPEDRPLRSEGQEKRQLLQRQSEIR